MTTAQAIEGITDAGNFEILATRALRLIDNDCQNLEHLGVNAEGKTIKNPVDGFCMVPGAEPARFVMAAFATDVVEKLERKWIFDHSQAPRAKKAKAADDGDLLKAGRRVESLRESYPDASFVVWLCTNKQPNDDLMEKVLKKAKQLGIDVRFLGRSRLRDILDTMREGQWLRKEHLGIQAERLSLSFLKELAYKSLESYGREFLITPPESFIETQTERALTKAFEDRRSVYVVTGASGAGKSVTCFRVLKSQLASGDLGIWIPGEIAARSNSFEEAIGATLRILDPAVEEKAGSDVLVLAGGSRHFLVIIDDIVRGGAPAETLRKILSWRRPSESDGDKRAQTASHSIVVPAWDLFWAPFDDHFRSATWLARLPISRMDDEEGCSCLTAALGSRADKLCAADQVNIVKGLAHDPILIALYADTFEEAGQVTSSALAVEVIERFVNSCTAEAAVSSVYGSVEFESALVRLASWILKERDLYPRWERVQELLSEDVVKPLRELIHLGKICRIVGRAEVGRFEFRHDRILEHFLSHALRRMFGSLDQNHDVISDPYYANYVGRALATADIDNDLMEWIKAEAPLALLTAVQFLPERFNETPPALIDAAIQWCQHAYRDSGTPGSLIFEASRVLEETDSTHVVDITESVLDYRSVWRARLANGAVDGIINEFSDPRWFSPAVTDRGLDAVIQRALHRHKASLIRQCSRLLESKDADDSIRCGALIFAGFVGDSSLVGAVNIAWSSMDDKPNAILPALWAGLRCADRESEGDISPFVAAWADLPDDNRESGLSERINVASQLDFSVRRGIPSKAIDLMVRVAQKVEGLRWPITVALKHLDDPSAIRFLLVQAAKSQQRANENGGYSMFISDLKQQWDPTSESRGKRLRPDAIEVIRTCWESNSGDASLQEAAFKCWISAVDDLNKLREISVEHPFFESVLWRRAWLRDVSAAALIAPILESDSHWFQIVSHVWSPPIQAKVDGALRDLAQNTPDDCSGGRTNNHYALAELLRDIPVDDAEPLLLSYWKHLQFSPLFVQAALYIGSPECVRLAMKAIGCYPENENAFVHISSFFGFYTTGLMDRLEQRHLDVLLPFMVQLGDSDLSSMAEYCRRHGRRDWAIRHLKPEFDRRRNALAQEDDRSDVHVERLGRHHFPSDDDLLEELDRIEQKSKHFGWDGNRWSEQFDERGDDHSRWRQLLEVWLSKEVSVSRLRVVAAAILGHGTRADLAIISNHIVIGAENEIEELRSNTVFGVMRRSIC
jgi:hypothetical protein